MVDGLSYKDLVDYCPKALAILLKECPGIQGLQLRMNQELGNHGGGPEPVLQRHGEGDRFGGSSDYGRLPGEGPDTGNDRLGAVVWIRPIVSTKYWREHMGLPFHETVIDPVDRRKLEHRYGYWDLLPHDRTFDVSYQFWTFGSQKILLWGSLDYARQFAESTHLGDAIGFEVFAPLSQRGFGNRPGGNWASSPIARWSITAGSLSVIGPSTCRSAWRDTRPTVPSRSSTANFRKDLEAPGPRAGSVYGSQLGAAFYHFGAGPVREQLRLLAGDGYRWADRSLHCPRYRRRQSLLPDRRLCERLSGWKIFRQADSRRDGGPLERLGCHGPVRARNGPSLSCRRNPMARNLPPPGSISAHWPS